jgi:hypothetical protein
MTAGILSVILSFVLLKQTPPPQYFPKGSFGKTEKLSKFSEDWYSKDLRAFDEPSLLEASKDKSRESYRFLFLRSFRHSICIRLDVNTDGSGLLTTKMLSGATGEVKTRIILNEQEKFTKKQVDWFVSRKQISEFWNQPSFDEQRGLDGEEWIAEGVKAGNYHVAARWSPTEGTAYAIGTLMLRTAKL